MTGRKRTRYDEDPEWCKEAGGEFVASYTKKDGTKVRSYCRYDTVKDWMLQGKKIMSEKRTVQEWDCINNGGIWVSGYTKKNGVKVRGYCRTSKDWLM